MKSFAIKLLTTSCLLAFSGGLLGACASTKIPSDQYGQPRETIRVVNEMGTENNPQAKLHLKLANDELENADAYIKKNKKEEAELSLMRAEADASLALSLLQKDQMQAEVQALEEKLERLRKETKALQGNS